MPGRRIVGQQSTAVVQQQGSNGSVRRQGHFVTHGDIVLSSGDASAIPRRRFIPQTAVDGLDAVQGFVGKREFGSHVGAGIEARLVGGSGQRCVFAFQLATALSTM